MSRVTWPLISAMLVSLAAYIQFFPRPAQSQSHETQPAPRVDNPRPNAQAPRAQVMDVPGNDVESIEQKIAQIERNLLQNVRTASLYPVDEGKEPVPPPLPSIPPPASSAPQVDAPKPPPAVPPSPPAVGTSKDTDVPVAPSPLAETPPPQKILAPKVTDKAPVDNPPVPPIQPALPPPQNLLLVPPSPSPAPVPPPPGAVPPAPPKSVEANPSSDPANEKLDRTQIRFGRPFGMKVHWSVEAAEQALSATHIETPGRFHFRPGKYRLKLTNIANLDGATVPVSMEVLAGNAKVADFLAQNAVYVDFTAEEFQLSQSGKSMVKVIYLPDPPQQGSTGTLTQDVRSNLADSKSNPLQEAREKGTVLVVLRMGAGDNSDPQVAQKPGPDLPRIASPGPVEPPGIPAPPLATVPPSPSSPSNDFKPLDVGGPLKNPLIPAKATPPAAENPVVKIMDRAPLTSPWSFHLEIVDGKNLLAAKVGKTIQFRVVCDKVDMQSPLGNIQATGNVKITSSGLEASTECMTINLREDAIVLEGKAQLKCLRDDQEIDLRSDRFSLRLSEIQSQTPTTSNQQRPPSVRASRIVEGN